MSQTYSKGIGMFLAFAIFSFFFIVSTILFVYFFRFHINMYIISNAERSRLSSLPLILFTVTHTDENYNYIIARNMGISADQYSYDIGAKMPPNQCYNMTIAGGVYNSCEAEYVGMGAEYVGMEAFYCHKSLYRLKYPLPIIYTDGKITEDFVLSIHNIVGTPMEARICI